MSHRPTILGPPKGKISAVIAPGAVDEVWYPIESMRRPHRPVIVSLLGGRKPLPRFGAKDDEHRGGKIVLAVVRRHPRVRKDWWYQIGTWSDAAYAWVRSREIALEMYGRNSLSRNSPVAWRPQGDEAWPDPLPEPLMPAFGPRRPKIVERYPDEPIDRHTAEDGWPHPGLPLGLKVPPKVREECEARILRAYRTQDAVVFGGSGGGGSFCSDIPSDMVKLALLNCERERLAEDGVTSFDALGTAWTPTKRDLSDWEGALEWLRGLDAVTLRVLSLRAANPPFSFRQIATKIRVKSPESVRRIYEKAINHAFAVAARTVQIHEREQQL